MSSWLYSFATLFVIPLIMIIFGLLFDKSAPSRINRMYGYRTKMSMKNQETWQFAHKLCGQVWKRIGLILLPCTTLPMLLVIQQNEDFIAQCNLALLCVQLSCLLCTFVPVELSLRRTFDQDGNRIG